MTNLFIVVMDHQVFLKKINDFDNFMSGINYDYFNITQEKNINLEDAVKKYCKIVEEINNYERILAQAEEYLKSDIIINKYPDNISIDEIHQRSNSLDRASDLPMLTLFDMIKMIDELKYLQQKILKVDN